MMPGIGCYVLRRFHDGTYIVHAPSRLDQIGVIVAVAENRQHAQAIVRRMTKEARRG